MLNDKEWQQVHPDFLDQSQLLLSTCQECIAHLEMISDDQDAIECLLGTLSRLAQTADDALIPGTADFARQLRHMLSVAYPDLRLTDEALQTLEHCLTLMAWQLELIDPRTGQLSLDDTEQKELLDKVAYVCGLEGCGLETCEPGQETSSPRARPDSQHRHCNR